MNFQPNKDVLFSFAHVDNFRERLATWRSELAQLAGRTLTDQDIAGLELNWRQQLGSGSGIFFDVDWNPVSEADADMLLLHTGLQFKDSNEEILVQYVKGKKLGNWMGFKFVKYGKKKLALYDFAFFPAPGAGQSWTDSLARKAAPEPWTLKSSTRQNEILFRFVSFSFERLQADGRIVESSGHAAFHTGLYTSQYEPIYAYFNLNAPNSPKWRLEDFCCRDEGWLGKEMARNLNLNQAKPANWFTDPARLYCNPDLLENNLDISVEHCVVDNAYRFPRNVLKLAAALDDDLRKCLGAKYPDEETERDAIASAIRSSSESANIVALLEGQLKSAIKLACRKIRCDYHAAVPQFYPDHGPDNDGFGHLIPLSFDKKHIEAVACALVVQPTADGKGYRAATILTPDMAYSNARLLRRPDAHWLTQQLKKDDA